MNPDGTVARGAQMVDYAHQQGLPMLTIADLMAHCREQQA